MKRKTRNILYLILYVLLFLSFFFPMFNVSKWTRQDGSFNPYTYTYSYPSNVKDWSNDYNYFEISVDTELLTVLRILMDLLWLICICFASASLLKEYTPKSPDKHGLIKKWNEKWQVVSPAVEIILLSLSTIFFERESYYSSYAERQEYTVNEIACIPFFVLLALLVIGEIDIYRRKYELNHNQTKTGKTITSTILRGLGLFGILLGSLFLLGPGRFRILINLCAALVYLVGRLLGGFPPEVMPLSENPALALTPPVVPDSVSAENKSPEPNKETAPAQIENNPADEIRKYHALLHDGIITQEEFNAKKEQLLGL